MVLFASLLRQKSYTLILFPKCFTSIQNGTAYCKRINPVLYLIHKAE